MKRKQPKIIRFLVLIVIVIGVYYAVYSWVQNKKNDFSYAISPLPAVETTSITQSPAPTEIIQKESAELKSVVESALEGTKGTYGIVVRNLKTGESYYSNEHTVFEAASLYKLWVMATVYKQIEEGVLTEDQVLTDSVESLNRKFSIASESAELTEGTVTYSIHDALKQMITISHNYAALLLSAKIRLATATTFLQDNGFSESKLGTTGGAPMSTPSDIALFFEKLYKGNLASPTYTEEMIGFLKGQQLNGGLPKYLPDASSVANKTGELGSLKHDAGIIFTDKGDYIIVVMSETNAPLSAQERIAQVSKGVYEYFTGK